MAARYDAVVTKPLKSAYRRNQHACAGPTPSGGATLTNLVKELLELLNKLFRFYYDAGCVLSLLLKETTDYLGSNIVWDMIPVAAYVFVGTAVITSHGSMLVIDGDDCPIFPVVFGTAGDFQHTNLMVSHRTTKGSGLGNGSQQ